MGIASEGLPFIITPLAAAAALLYFRFGIVGTVLAVVLIALGLFCAFFFRDPARVIPADPNAVLSPCDGTVMEVTQEDGRDVIRVFLSVFNVHVQRSPVAGSVTAVRYVPGKFLPAMRPEACIVNEQNVITIDTPRGQFVVKQIAGILARRVVAWARTGDTLAAGQHIGLIKFGSQVDLYLPPAAKPAVKVGEVVVGGETIMARMS